MEEEGDLAPIELDGQPFSGLVASLSLDTGRVIGTVEVANGYRDGLEADHDVNGELVEAVQWVRGQAIGLAARWESSGELVEAKRLHFGHVTQRLTPDANGVLSVEQPVDVDEQELASTQRSVWGHLPPPARVTAGVAQLLGDVDLHAQALFAEATRAVEAMSPERLAAYRQAYADERAAILGQLPD